MSSLYTKIKKLLGSHNLIDNQTVLHTKNDISTLADINVSDIMVTREKIFAFSVNTPKAELMKSMHNHYYTRIPIYQDNLDNIIGFIHIKDILGNINNDFKITDIMRNIIFVPIPMKAIDLLIKMQSSHIHVAIVLDEYGGTDGLVTIVNIIEEFLGNMDDEHDQDNDPTLIKLANNRFAVEGRISINTLECALNIKLEKTDDYDTISGYINTLLGRIPKKGEIIKDNNNIAYQVIEVDERCIHKVIIDVSDKNKKCN